VFMDIRKIAINGLFGEINHEIDLSDSISIIMGDNGVGKTVILSIIKAIYEDDFRTLLSFDFDKVVIWFKNRKDGRITYTKEGEDKIMIDSSSRDNETFEVSVDDVVVSTPSFVHEISPNKWIDMRSHMTLNLDELRQYYGSEIFEVSEDVLPDWYKRIFNNSKVHMIGTQRLFQISYNGRKSVDLKVLAYSRQLSNYISQELSNAGKYAAELDRTFPTRLVEQLKGNKKYETDKLVCELERLEQQRSSMSEVGFIDKIEEAIDVDAILNANQDKTLLNVIRLYIKDSNRKIDKYQDAANKVSLFLRIINKRLSSKIVSVNTEKGFIVTSLKNRNRVIPTDRLSSGEQNEIVLFYDLIFNCDKCSLVLIDEPEISLHLEWLQQMLDDFKDIVKQNGMKMLIATHSPDFVGDNYDLVQNLTYE